MKFKRWVSAAVLCAMVFGFGAQAASAATGPVIGDTPQVTAPPSLPAPPDSNPGNVQPEGRLQEWMVRAALLLMAGWMRITAWQNYLMSRISSWCSDEAAAAIGANWDEIADEFYVIAHLPVTVTMNLVYDRMVRLLVEEGSLPSVAVSGANALKEAVIWMSGRYR